MTRTYTERDYQRAEHMLQHHRAALITGMVDRPVWLEKSESFWCATSSPAGVEYLVVDPVAGTRRSAFDHPRLAAALSRATGRTIDRATLRLSTFEFEDGDVIVELGGRRWRCSLEDYVCTPVESSAVGPGESRSPNGRWTVFVRDHNLWLRDETGAEVPLTRDGTADNGYAVDPMFGRRRPFMGVDGAVASPVVQWSPDGSKLLTHRMDERDVEVLHLVESTPASARRPMTHTCRYPMPDEPGQPKAYFVVVDPERRTVTPSTGDPVHTPYVSPVTWGRVWWSSDGETVYYLDPERFGRCLRLIAVDAVTGRSRVIIEEHGKTRVEPTQIMADPAMVHLCGNGELLWYSQRDGWGHLYRYTPSGALINQVTRGTWAVRGILHVDEEDGVVYFSASGLVSSDPYLRQLCRINLDGTGFARLTDDVDDHVARISPLGSYLVDTASRADKPPLVVVRDLVGRVVVEVARADVSALVREGWAPPERFTVKAADGVTDIYGTLWRPYGFDPNLRYPVVDHIYPGPQSHRAPQNFENNYTGEAEAFAALGFAVVAIDGRGTPGRSKEFHDASYGRLGDGGGLDDHVVGIIELGRRYPWLDTDRVGITGSSGGGFAAVRAVLAHPDFFQAGISVAGCHDIRQYLSFWGETYHGPWDPESYRVAANSELAGNLRGKLLLVHGELDDNVPHYQTLGLVDALIEANRDFEMLLVPGVGHHMLHREGYVIRRRWDFFVRNLMNALPPSGYRLADIPFC
ncbi:S9 family peptidase [Kutzneria chonburiensis]|uniref:DPP IV N-terminal domain-containing protein n=1 Tax=Kutzneria chonburiensis TaxID=1483604 RepID=A0ABV6MK67_9PSEU